jgi:hypothetical protein
MTFACAIPTEGAHPFDFAQGRLLRFLQGWAAMLHALLDWLRRDMDQQPCACIPDSRLSRRTRRTGHPLYADAS